MLWQGWRLRSDNDFLLKILEMKGGRCAIYIRDARKTKRCFDPIHHPIQEWHVACFINVTTCQHASTDCTLWGAVNFMNLHPSICSIWKRQNFQPSPLTILDRYPQLYLTVTLMIRPLKNMTDHRVKGATEGVRNRATLGLTDSDS